MSVYGRTRAEVQEKLRAAVGEREGGTLVVGRSPTLAQYIERWLEAVRPNLRSKTYTSYEGTMRLHVLPRLGRVTLRKLSPSHVQELLTWKTGTGLSARSVRYMLLVLRIALGQAERWGLVSRNVAVLVDGPRVPHRSVTVLTVEDCRRFLQVIEGDRLEALYTLALALGLRHGELLALRWSDMDLESRRLVVGAALQRVPGQGQKVVETKTARSRRVVTMPNVCVRALRAHRVRQVQDKLLAGSRWLETGFVFTSLTGTPLDGDQGTRRFKRVLRGAGLPGVRFHDLRHGAASMLLAQGVPSRVVMDMLGHSQIGVTMNTYTHVMPSLVDEAAAAIDRALGVSAET